MSIKRIFLILVVTLLISCDSDSGLNCFQASGDIIQTELTVAPFTKITVWERTQLIIQEGPVQKVVLETGENLLNDIDIKVEDDRLSIINNNGCNLVRDYGITKIYVTSPNITEIRSSTGLPIESIGTLKYPQLKLLSEDQGNEDFYHIDGDFRLSLDVDYLSVVANGLSTFYLDGDVRDAHFGLYGSDCSILAPDLKIDRLIIFHRSTDVMVVNPQQSIKGRIVSLGDCISKNRPDVVDVDTPYKGKLIFNFD